MDLLQPAPFARWDLTGAWTPFGGMSAQLTHLGLVLDMSVVENATIAMTYAKYFREQAAHLARQRAATIDRPHFLAVWGATLSNETRSGSLAALPRTKNFHRPYKTTSRRRTTPRPERETARKRSKEKGKAPENRPKWPKTIGASQTPGTPTSGTISAASGLRRTGTTNPTVKVTTCHKPKRLHGMSPPRLRTPQLRTR